jgi:hypothetical protein
LSWSVAQKLACRGGNKTTHYVYADRDAFAATGQTTLYYRIKQTDLDGHFMYSNILRVSQNDISASRLLAEPNPFNSTLSLIYSAAETGDALVNIFDTRGVLLDEMHFTLEAGINKLDLSKLSALEAGVYIASLTMDGRTVTVRILRD